MQLSKSFGLSVLAAVGLPALAAGGHQHGVGALEIALDGSQLVVSLTAPRADLGQDMPLSLVEVRGGDCTAGQVARSESAVEHEHEHKDHDHKDHDHDTHDQSSGGHSDVTWTQTFDCASSGQIQAMTCWPLLHPHL